MKQKTKVVWAVDPFEKDSKVLAHAAAILKGLSSRLNAVIYPVYVLSDGLLGVTVGSDALTNTYKELAMAKLEHKLGTRGMAKLENPLVLVCAPSSPSIAADALDRYAIQKGADFIFVSSHGRGGLRRAFLGSFAETLVLYAQTPVMISGPRSQVSRTFDRVLFPTDFGAPSLKALGKALAVTKQLGARLTILHAVPNSIELYASAGATLLGGGFIPVRTFAENHAGQQRKLAQDWVKKAQAKGVKTDAIVDVANQSAAFSTLEWARKKKAGLVVMSSQSSGFSAAVLGSVGREIARSASCPVLFLRSKS